MNQGSQDQSLEELTEETARQIIWTLTPGATGDLLTAVKQLLYGYLENASIKAKATIGEIDFLNCRSILWPYNEVLAAALLIQMSK